MGFEEASASKTSPLPAAAYPAFHSQRQARLRHLFSYVVLITSAFTLSALLPTSPWLFLKSNSVSKASHNLVHNAPAAEWKDDVYPFRPPAPWDISTDYAFPRKLEYDVQEGTWLRLDVHPTSGDIVFDMVGDLYCLPGTQSLHPTETAIRARRVLSGVPYDSNPHFSPTGDRIVFKSDAELGVENLWVMEWKGCDDMDLNPTNADEELRLALANKDDDEYLLSRGLEEDALKKRHRLIREGRINAQRVTNETYRWVSDARFHPSGSKVIATKWYMSERSLGAGEGWEYSVPSLEDLRSETTHSVQAGDGKRVVGRTLPLGWSPNDYGEQQIGPEQFIWKGRDSLIYSKNVVDEHYFTYSKDVYRGIYAIFQTNLTTGETETLVDSSPGGANRPELSRDGKTLAFVRRVRDKEALVVKDLETGSIHNIWYGLTYDLSGISAPMGTYPTFAFTPDDSAVVIWAAGQIYYVPLSVNEHGERVASSIAPRPIPFKAHIEKQLAETLTGGTDLVSYETQEKQQVHAFRDLRVNHNGTRAVFQAGGLSYWKDLETSEAVKVPVTDDSAAYYSPSFVPFEDELVIHARWSDLLYTKFELADLKTNQAYEIQGTQIGRYFSPVLCNCHGPSRTIAFLKSGGTYLSGDILATAGAGLYLGDIVLPESSANGNNVSIENLRFVPSEINTNDHVNMRFLDGNKKLLVQQSARAFTIDLEGEKDKFGKPPHATLALGRASTEVVVAPAASGQGLDDDLNIAFVDVFNIYLAPGADSGNVEPLWSKPGNATEGIVRVSLDGGHDVTFTADGKKLLWFLGPYLHSLDLSTLSQCKGEISDDRITFGIKCVKSLVDFQMVVVEHDTDITRLKKEARQSTKMHKEWLDTGVPDLSDSFVVYNATILTMDTDDLNTDIIRGGFMLVRGGVIQRIGEGGHLQDIDLQRYASLDAQGGFVIPGFIDVHAHWNGFSDPYPTKSWELETFLAYGVTTLHNPSADQVGGFAERVRVERGQMVGPRIFTVGVVIYGGGEAQSHQDIFDMDEARSALLRIKAEGGPASISYKNYNLPSRASRQRLLKEGSNLSMLCVPEGGMNYDWDLTYIFDGMTTIEHAIPVPTLYDDVLTLYALSGTASTPTHIVNYGGAWGEQLVWATDDVPNDPKLRRFTRHDILEALSESTSRPATSFALFNTSRSVAAMVSKGLLANIGAHGEPPIGLNYHAEMGFTGNGGLSNYEVLRAATSSGAKTLGLFSSLGSLSPKKLADFLIYPPGVDLLEGEVSEKTLKLQYVARGGRIWEAETMTEFWPVKGAKQTMPVINAD